MFSRAFCGTVKVLWWEGARDKSRHGIARLYLDPQRAEEDLRLARALSRGEAVWFLEDLTVVGSEAGSEQRCAAYSGFATGQRTVEHG